LSRTRALCGPDRAGSPRVVSVVATLALASLLVALAALALPARRAGAAVNEFVTRCGIHFCLDGKPFYVAGTNTYDVFTYGGSYGDTETQYMDKTRIDTHLANLASDGVTVLRLWTFSHEEWHGFEPSEGKYNEQQFALFDYVMVSAAEHGIRLIPVFENYWEAYGGIDTRLTWEGLGTGQANRWRFFDKSACPGCFTQYKNYVKYVLNRENHYTGVKYKDDPTVFAWELMNEPRFEGRGTQESTQGTTLRAWVDEMGSYIKGLDGNHLLGTGLEGHESRYGFGGDEGNPFIGIHQSEYVDFTSAHPYPNAGWAALSLDKTLALIRAWIGDSHEKVGKPFFMGEFNTENVDRSQWWKAIFQVLEDEDAAGSAFWWYPDAQAGGDNHSVKHGDPALTVFSAHAAAQAAKSGVVPTKPPTTTPAKTPTPTGDALCAATYRTVNSWQNGYQGEVTVKNTGEVPMTGWTVTLEAPRGQTVTQVWNASLTGSGSSATVSSLAWNGALGAGASTTFGFTGDTSGADPVPPTLACTAN
jgi:hypothetical protein